LGIGKTFISVLKFQIFRSFGDGEVSGAALKLEMETK
jgi:hypothetical protein